VKAETVAEEAFIKLGQQHKEQRILEANESLLETPPTPDEQQLIHRLFVTTLDGR